MTITELTTGIANFVREHHEWAVPVVFTLAFLESLAFLSLLVPATAILLAISAVIGASGISIVPLWIAGGLGGAIGYSLSYMLGAWYGERTFELWPFRSQPALVDRSRAFFARYGVASVFIGHFIGPIRAFIPVIAGVYGVNRLAFEAANVLAAFIWITSVLSPGFATQGLMSAFPR
ncbi:MAG: DedA family protein [Proteobacteria bacterium]|nr:DedA family protein [Pseudomonadota bacterium]